MAVEKKVELSTANYFRKCKKVDEAIALGGDAKPFTAASQT